MNQAIHAPIIDLSWLDLEQLHGQDADVLTCALIDIADTPLVTHRGFSNKFSRGFSNKTSSLDHR